VSHKEFWKFENLELALAQLTALRARQKAGGRRQKVNVMDYTDNGMPSALPCP